MAALWIWNSVMGVIVWELYERNAPGQISDDEMHDLPPELAPRVQQVRNFVALGDYLDRYFEFHIERLVGALHDLTNPIAR